MAREKISGEKVLLPIHYSNLMLIDLDLSDPWRKKILKIEASGEEGENSD